MSIMEAVEQQHGRLAEMCEEGDRNSVRWGPSAAEREEAKATFDRFRARGWSVFRLTADGERGRRLDEFDPNARGMIAVPQMEGG